MVKSKVTKNSQRSNILIQLGKLIFIYFQLTANRFYKNNGLMRSSALAYSLLFALIPLIASLSLLLSQFYELYKTKINFLLNQQEIESLILHYLPYNTIEINNYILSFVNNAMKIGWFGIIVFMVTIILLIGSLEKLFNITWHVENPRPLYRRIGMVFYIIVLFSVSFSLSIIIGKLNIFEKYLLIKIPGKLISFILLVFAFSVLYKLVPAIKVKFSSALLGGFLAASLYDLARVVFQQYVKFMFAYNKIYGSLVIIPFFIISLFMLSLIIILGSEMSYTAQHYGYLYDQYLIQKENKA